MDNIDIRQKVIESAFGLARAIRRGPRHMEHDLPLPVERTLAVISANDGLSSGELCELLDMRPSSVSELTDKMTERGLIEKSQDESDKRVSRIFLTELPPALRMRKQLSSANLRLSSPPTLRRAQKTQPAAAATTATASDPTRDPSGTDTACIIRCTGCRA